MGERLEWYYYVDYRLGGDVFRLDAEINKVSFNDENFVPDSADKKAIFDLVAGAIASDKVTQISLEDASVRTSAAGGGLIYLGLKEGYSEYYGKEGSIITFGVEEVLIHELAHVRGFPVNGINNYGETGGVAAENVAKRLLGKNERVYYGLVESDLFLMPYTPKAFDDIKNVNGYVNNEFARELSESTDLIIPKERDPEIIKIGSFP
jgi:hypothetical protein